MLRMMSTRYASGNAPSYKVLMNAQSPLGTWPKNRHLKDLGRIAQRIVIDGIEPYTLALFTRILGQAREETEEYMERVRQDLDLNCRSAHLYGRVHFIYGQKPMDG